MLVAILADTHMPRGARRIPAAALRRLAAADLILHAGDLVAAAVLDDLGALGPPVVAVRGNCDDATLARRLPEAQVVDREGIRIAVVHDAGPAAGRLARLRRRFPDADAVVFGHSHMPLHERDGPFQIFNPGSPTERRRAPTRTIGLGRIEHAAITFEHVDLGPDGD